MTYPSRNSIDKAHQAWRAAESFAELCDLGARFVRGKLPAFPGWGSPTLDVESDAIAPALARLNELGVLTLCSQPGILAPERALEQRAFLCAFVEHQTWERLRVLEHDQELGVSWQRRGESPARRTLVPVTIERGATRVELGAPAFEAELECFRGAVSPKALAELEQCVHFTVWDARFGRDEHLWRALLAAAE